MYKNVVIFGGTGFVGLHMTQHLLSSGLAGHVYLLDIKPIDWHPAHIFVNDYCKTGLVTYVNADVRLPIDLEFLNGKSVDLIFNLAAIHREPGHHRLEYFETNIRGAENITDFARNIGCQNIVFTSSISPYGPSEDEINEGNLTAPETPYGSSKLAAEYIHKLWKQEKSDRQLTIVRPGVIFGPGEGGNVSRLVKAVAKYGFFVRVGGRDVRKAGVYVKELCHAVCWLLELGARRSYKELTANITFDPGPTLDDYVNSIKRVTGRNAVLLKVPSSLVLLAAHLIHGVLGFTKIGRALDPVRVRKITRSNNVRAGFLVSNGYKYIYDLDSALSDWKKDLPSEWK